METYSNSSSVRFLESVMCEGFPAYQVWKKSRICPFLCSISVCHLIQNAREERKISRNCGIIIPYSIVAQNIEVEIIRRNLPPMKHFGFSNKLAPIVTNTKIIHEARIKIDVTTRGNITQHNLSNLILKNGMKWLHFLLFVLRVSRSQYHQRC